MPNDPILVHLCCAPCLAALLDWLRERRAGVAAYFHNPNLHPLIEFRRRLKACHILAEQEAIELHADEQYGLEPFLDALGSERGRPERCHRCYALRLNAAARRAAELGFPLFTSTLLASPQQDREVICELGHAAAQRHGVRFDDTDHRPRHDAGIEIARRRQLYRQQYCGCVFSEYDRYANSSEHLYRPQVVARGNPQSVIRNP
jgi:predicted adenine nucleotide alpha hydrolase (AANH) superfamily ATPase